jgi:GNAT superfamily N-acetyltransferase
MLMRKTFVISPLATGDHEEVARLLHRSLVDWYEKHLRQGSRFGDRHEPFLLFPQVYEALDPGQAITARNEDGRLAGVCFIHPRETHVAVGIVVTAPEAAGRGVARAMMQAAIDRARAADKPLRLVSSLLNLDSFSLYSRLGLTPHTMYQDLLFDVPEQGMRAPPPPGIEGVRLARAGEAVRLADFEHDLQGIRREEDYAFFLKNAVGDWRIWVRESESDGVTGVLVASHHPHCGMVGPGVARDEAAAAALLWRALDERRGSCAVFLVPCAAANLVRTLYSWGARNVELHVAQILGPIPAARGVAFPTFLPETA